MKILGVSAGFHDAALTVLHNHKIIFAGHSERYSKKKNDSSVSISLQQQAIEHGPFDKIVYYEKPYKRQLRKLKSGEPWGGNWRTESELRSTIPFIMEGTTAKISSVGHHLSHAAAGFQTSPFDDATVVVIDAIGESDTISIYNCYYNGACLAGEHARAHYDLIYKQSYPHSIGMFYSAVTKRVGLNPMDEEYITMGMAAYGDASKAYTTLKNALVENIKGPVFKENLHIGMQHITFLADVTNEDIAAAGQQLCEEMIMDVMRRARRLTKSRNLVYMGGVALNCVANSRLGELFDNVWIMPNPGDAGSSLGAAAIEYGRDIRFNTAFLGTDIKGDYPVKDLMYFLKKNQIVGVASGRAEFGPRALGNRSLLADPRGKKIKDQVNEIKRRQKFRPFAPVILEEYVDQYFDMPVNQPTSRYMQVVAKCRYPKRYPAIVHVDGTSRVQTVPQGNSGIRKLLEAWNKQTGCPMLLNTSLNIRGEPMVDTRADADRFTQEYGVTVCS
jgi:carbamoyltransferase